MFDSVVLEVEGLEKRYRSFGLRVSFHIAPGEVLGVVGPNGVGKTTMIYCLLGIVKPSGGRIRFFGLDLKRQEVAIKQRVGFFLEEAPLFRQMRASDVLKFFASFYPSWDWGLAQRLIRQFELDVTKKVSELSKGMRAKLGLVTAFSHRPQLVILDEPTAGLDPGMRREFVHVVRTMRKEFHPAVLLTSHIMADVEDLANRVAFLRGGRMSLIEDKVRLLERWRRIRGRCRDPLGVKFDEWVAVEYDRATGELQLVTSDWDVALVERLREAGLQDVEVCAMNLEEIYVYVTRGTHQEGVASASSRAV